MRLGKIPVVFLFSGILFLVAGIDAQAQRNKPAPGTSANEPETKQSIQAELISALQEKFIGNPKGAISLLEAFTQKHPEIAAGHYELAELYVSNNMYSQALEEYKKATALDGKNKWYWVSLAEMYDYLKLYKESKEIYKKLAAMYPNELEYALSAVSILLQQGQLEEALDILTKIESEIGVTESINMEKYRLYMAQKKFLDALKELEKLQSLSPNETLYMGMAAEVYYAKGDKKKALESYLKILQIDSNNALIHLAIADYYQKEKELDNAFHYLEKAFANKAVDVDKKVMILLSFLEQAKNSDAHRKEGERLTKLLTETHPESPKSWSIAGDYALEQKNWRMALDDFGKVIEIDASKFIFFRQVGELSIRVEDYQKLQALASTSEEMYPMQPETFLYKGIALTQSNKFADAEKALNFGKELVIENPTLASNFMAALGTLYALKKETAKANESFDKAIQLAPGNYWAYQQYAMYAPTPEKGVSMADKSIMLAPEFPETYAAKAKVLYKKNNLTEATLAIEKAFQNGGNQIKSTLLLYADISEKNGNAAKATQLRAEANAI